MKGWTADPETGTVPLLLQAYDRNVSDLDQMWESVDEYRDQVRAIQAQGIVGLELIIDHWDSETGEYVAPLRAALDDGLDTVVDMYSVGVRPTGPDGQSFVQLRDNIAISSRLTQNAIPEKDKWLWNTTSNKQDTIMTKEFLEPYLKEMLDNYRPENHDDMTLEEYLVSKDVPTK